MKVEDSEEKRALQDSSNRKENDHKSDQEPKIQIDAEKLNLTSTAVLGNKEHHLNSQEGNEIKHSSTIGNNNNNQRRESYSISSKQNKPQSVSNEHNAINERQQKSIHEQVSSFVRSKVFDYSIIILVLFYTGIIFAYFALDTKEYQDNDGVQLALNVIQYIELGILIIFCIEIFLRVYALSSKEYFKDVFNSIDAVIILLSLILTILDIIITENTFSQISRIIRSIFRFVRLFLVFRKVNEISQTSSLNLKGMIQTPVEKIMEIMQSLEQNIEDPDLAKQLRWCMEMVSSNKLYEPILGDGEAAVWGNIYATNQNNNQSKKKKTLIQKVNPSQAASTALDPSTPFQFNFKPMLVPMEHVEYFKKLDEISFDPFVYHEQIKENNLSYLLVHLFNRYDIFFRAKIDPQHLFNWANLVSKGYLDNIYHNKIHAFDVTQVRIIIIFNSIIQTIPYSFIWGIAFIYQLVIFVTLYYGQTMHYFLQTLNFKGVADLTALEIGLMYMASAAHDYQHPGYNNPYLVNTRSELAIRYNDKSPLENHHAFSAFLLMQQENCNVFIHLSKEDLKKSRERVIQMILHTDNSQHFADLAKLKGRLSAADFDPKDKDKDICMVSLLHSADVSNPYKPWDICQTWTKKVLEEFWQQGDQERLNEMTITYLCDRYTTNTSKSQAGFIDFIVKPLFETVQKFIPLLDLSPLEKNKALWGELTAEYDKQLEKINLKIPA